MSSSPDTHPLLSRIPGSDVARALRMLPPAASATVDRADVEIDVAEVGRVRLTCMRMRHRHGRSEHWFWVADRAVQVGSADRSMAAPTSPG